MYAYHIKNILSIKQAYYIIQHTNVKQVYYIIQHTNVTSMNAMNAGNARNKIYISKRLT